MNARLFPIASLALALALNGCGAREHGEEDAPETTTPSPTPPSGTPPSAGVAPGERAMPLSPLTDLPEREGALTNLPAILARVGLAPYHARQARGQNLTIAVLDNGFAGFGPSLGRRLPPDTMLIQAPGNELQETSHGTKMAEIAYAVATGSPSYRADRPGPRMLLLNANGFTNFKAAIDRVIAEKADIVLYAQVWEYGGNLDGGGFINREVNRALAQGITWINAAGNLGLATWAGPVQMDQETFVRFTVPQDATPVKVVLAWNDFDDSKDYRTPQDLDLHVEDSSGKQVGVGELIQDGKAPTGRGEKYSAHAREIVKATLRAGTYTMRVRAKSRNFDALSRFRLTVDGLGARVLEAQTTDSLLIPADNAGVLAIGAADAVPESGRGRGKPELATASEVIFSSGTSHRGTSSASAITAGALAVLQSHYGNIDRAELMQLIADGKIAVACPAAENATGACTAPVFKLVTPDQL